MRYLQNMSSFIVLTMLAGFGSLLLDDTESMAQPPCSITIEKVSVPANNTQFDFSITGDINDGFILSDPSDPTFQFGIGIEQTVTVTEDVPPGWTLESIECTEGVTNCGAGVFEPCLSATVNGNGVTFECLDNDTASCTFTNVLVQRNIPTISEWGLISLAAILGIAGLMVMKRRKATA